MAPLFGKVAVRKKNLSVTESKKTYSGEFVSSVELIFRLCDYVALLVGQT